MSKAPFLLIESLSQDKSYKTDCFTLATRACSCIFRNQYIIFRFQGQASSKFNLSADIAAQGKEYLANTFLPPYENYDVIIGYRADDSYFSFAPAFLNNTISPAQLERAMFQGDSGKSP